MGFDIAPAQVQSYYSPLLDVPFYALVASGLPAYAIAFLMGLPFGAAGWFFYRISRDVVRDLGIERDGFVLALVALVALTAAAGFSQIGSTMNEWATAVLVMAALFVLVRARRAGDGADAGAGALAGLICGAAAGLKLTATLYVLALGVVVLVCFRGQRGYARMVVAFALCATAGLALAYGNWASLLWKRFGNPFFPYFNAIFRSEWWEPQSFFDTKFRPSSFLGWLTLPFRLVVRNRLMSEADLRDPRLALLIVSVAWLAVRLARRAHAAHETVAVALRRAMPPSLRLLAVFVAAAYVAWLGLFTVYRYAIPLELVASLLLVVALRAILVPARRPDVGLGIAAALVVAVTVPPYWGRARVHTGPYFDVQVPQVPSDALIMLTTGEPFAYLIPFIGSGPRVVAPVSNFTGPWHHNRLQRELAAVVAGHRGPVYSIRYLDATSEADDAAMAAYGFVRGACEPIRSNLESRPVGLCRLARQP
jgi:hypothetical protein